MKFITKKITLFLLVMALLLQVKNTSATHIMGADIKWTCLGNHRYEVTMSVYRDCRGIGTVANRQLRVFCADGSGTPVQFGLPRVSIRDVSPFCIGSSGPCNPPNTNTGQQGVEEHVYTGVIDFNTGALKTMRDNGCCRFRLSVQECCRNNAISTLSPPGNFYTDAEIDLCNIDDSWQPNCDNSPDLRNPPVVFACCSQPFYFNNGVVDTDGDSLVFSLAPSIVNDGVLANYVAPFNHATWPLTAACPVNPNRPPGQPCPCVRRRPVQGFCFDPITGDMTFVPIECEEVAVIIVKIEQWRRDDTNSKWLYLGYTKRELQLWISSCPGNNPPELDPLTPPQICEGDRVCFTIKARDEEFSSGSSNQNWQDTIDLTWNQGLPGASFDVGPPSFTMDQGVIFAIREVEICWQTKVGDGREAPYLFTVNARDRACPMNATSSRGYSVKVNRTAYADRILREGDCGKYFLHSIPHDSFWYQGTYAHDWAIRDSTNSGEPVFRSNRRTDSLQFREGGKYIITYMINNPPLNCPSEYFDTIVVPPMLQVELRDTFVCEGDTVRIEMEIKNGTPPYFKSWENPIGTPVAINSTTLDISTRQNINIGAFVVDEKGCTANDTNFVLSSENPIPFIGPDRRICSYDTLFLQSNYPADSIWKFHWSPAPMNRDSAQSIWRNQSSMIYHKVIDSIGCWGIDSMELIVNEKVVALAGLDNGVCIFDTVAIEGNRLPKGHDVYFEWLRLEGASKIFVSNDSTILQSWGDTTERSYELYVRVTEGGVACEDSDTMNLEIWPLPEISFRNVDPVCFDYGRINLNSSIGPRPTPENVTMFHREKGIVSGGPGGFAHFFETDSFPQGTQPKYGPQGTWVQADYIDDNGCYNIDSFRVIIDPNPRLELYDSAIYCQNAVFPRPGGGTRPQGHLPIGNSIENGGIVNFAELGSTREWKILNAPSGVPQSTWSTLLIQGQGNDLVLPVGPPGDRSKIGIYTIQLCVRNVLTNCSTCDTAVLEVVELPEIELSFIPNQCVNFDTLFLDRYVNLRDGLWQIKSGPMNANEWLVSPDKFMPFRGPGLFELRYIHTATGCRVADSTQVNVSPLPQIRLDTFSMVCNTDELRQLRSLNPPNPGENGRWTGFGVTQTGNNYFLDPGASPKTQQIEGPYWMRFDYKNPITQCENRDSFQIRIQSEPEIEITSPKPFQQCEFTPFALETEMRFANTITWSHTGDGELTEPKSLSTTYTHGTEDTANGNLMMRVQTDPFGVCPRASDSTLLIIQPYPQIDFVADTLNGCQPLLVNFSSLISKPIDGDLSYYWEFDTIVNSSADANPSFNYQPAGDYTIKLIVVNNNGQCSTELVKEDYISVYPVPTAAFTTSPSYYTTLARPRFRTINNSQIEFGSLSYFWDFGSGEPEDTSHQFEPEINYHSDTGQYLIQLWVESEHGCSDSTEQWVRIGPDVTVYIPNAFSPNNFGPQRNDRFYVTAQGIIAFNVRVFNRWGEKLYESDDIEEGWDGKHNNVDCQQDVYMYIVNVTGFDGKEYEYSGTVTLVR